MTSHLDQIQDESKAYSNLTSEALEGMESDELHGMLSRLLNQLDRHDDNRRAMAGAYSSLIKKMKCDIRAINHEIRQRPQRESWGAATTIETIQPVLDSGLSALAVR